jgi:hypothetical protein
MAHATFEMPKLANEGWQASADERETGFGIAERHC